MCWFEAQSEFKWWSGEDVSAPLLGLVCKKVEHAPEGVNPTQWWRFWKLMQLLGEPPLF